MKTALPIIGFTVALLAFMVGIGMYVDNISGVGGGLVTEEIGPEWGEALFWGKGTCGNCHKIGSRGSNTRCPDLAGIGSKAVQRAKEISKTRGETDYYANKYLVESIANPKAYEVKGFSPTIMPKLFETVPLKRDEIIAILSYLQLQGADLDIEALEKHREMIPKASGKKRRGWGNAVKGEKLFFDTKSDAGCVRCHSIGKKGTATIGPNLKGIGGQSPGYLLESIAEPSKVLVKGYVQYLVKDSDEIIYTGQVYRSKDKAKWDDNAGEDFDDWLEEDEDTIYFIDSNAKESDEIAKEDIEAGPIRQKLSMMPGDFTKKLSYEDIVDIVQFLLKQK